MIRTFHPVGQGAFYTEKFDNFTMVYDCGGSTKDIIIERIDDAFIEKEEIDAVFISHLHNDHVNGLEHLLKKCNVKQLFLPLIEDKFILPLIIQNKIKNLDSQLSNDLIMNPIGTVNDISQDTKVYFIQTVNQETFVKNEFENLNFDNLPNSGTILPQNTKLFSNRIKGWVYIPFNFLQLTKVNNFNNELKKRGIRINDVDSFKALWPQEKKKIKAAYNTLHSDLNITSQTLYSGPDIYGKHLYINKILSNDERFRSLLSELNLTHNRSGCLYFGDYKTRNKKQWNELYNNYEPYWDLIGTVQIPHHGSIHDYNRKINSIKPMISVVSAKVKNRYIYLLSETIQTIIDDGGCVTIITEAKSTELKCEIKI